jgi:hypothetical protein
MTPNDIIAALLDVASAAYGVTAMRSNRSECAEYENKLETALDELNKLPQPANQPPLTPSAKARHYMQSFLQGAPVRIGSEEFTAALILSGLNENVDKPRPRGFGNPTAAEINDITMDTLGKWPSFEAQSWACKVVTAVAEKLRSQDIAAARDKLLADTAGEAHRIWNDAELLASLRRLCGYVENGSSESIGISQDDATGEWVLRIGPSMSPRVRHFHARSFHQVIRLAADDMLENEMCKFCGFEVEFPCDEPPPDICSAAIRAAEKQKRVKPDVKVTADVTQAVAAFDAASDALKAGAREVMKQTLIQLKDQVDSVTAKRIIAKVGGVRLMADIPDNLVNAVTIAARDRMALERRLAELRAAGDFAGVESLLRGTEEKAVAAASMAREQGGVEKQMQDRIAEVPLFAPSAAPSFPLPVPRERPEDYIPGEETFPPAEELKGQGGEFDGGGASGDFQ